MVVSGSNGRKYFFVFLNLALISYQIQLFVLEENDYGLKF